MCKNREGKAFVSCQAVQTLFKASYLQESTIKPRIHFRQRGSGGTQKFKPKQVINHSSICTIIHGGGSINSTQTGIHTGIFAQFVQNMVWINHRCTTLFLLLHSIVVVGSIRPRSTSFVGSIRPRSTSLLETEMYAGIRGACTSNTKWPPKDPKSDKTDQVPMQAMCGYCQNAVYSVAMGGGAGTGCTTATDNGMEACEKLAKEVDGKASAIKKFYEEKIEELGPGGGWSMEFCLDMSCCKMK